MIHSLTQALALHRGLFFPRPNGTLTSSWTTFATIAIANFKHTIIKMCLVCFINAEEARSKKLKDVFCVPSTSTTNSTASDESSDDGLNTDTEPTPNSHAIHYFAIGSMTNMTAMALRELSPISSQPAILQAHRMVFRGSGGMATAEKDGRYEVLDEYDSPEYPFSCIHGVLHLLSAPQMKVLDDFEGGYKRRKCKVLLYDGRTEVNAYVYQMDRAQWKPSLTSLQNNKPTIKHELPTERYLDIIAQGCESHGVDPKWVEFVRSHKCVPRKSAYEFSSFSPSMTTATVPIIPWEEVRACNGLNGTKMWIVINNKVLEFKGDVTSFFPFGYFTKHKIGGTDFTVKFAKGFFEPKYIQGHSNSSGSGGYTNFSHVTSSAQLGNEHRAWVEDQFACPPPALASSKWALVGVVDVSAAPSDPATLTRNSTFGLRRTKLVSCPNSSSSSPVCVPIGTADGIAAAASNDDLLSLPIVSASMHTTSAAPAGAPPAGVDSQAQSAHTHPQSGTEAQTATETGTPGCHKSAIIATPSTSLGNTNQVATRTAATEILDLTDDINAGFNHLFISGTTSGTWVIPDGIHPGQTLYVRKTATENFDASVTIRIKNQSLSSPNRRSDRYEMPINVYYLSWCWDGEFWYLEQVGRADT